LGLVAQKIKVRDSTLTILWNSSFESNTQFEPSLEILCACVLFCQKPWFWGRLEGMGIMEKWEIDAESQNYVSALSRLALAHGTRPSELVSKTCIFATVTTSSGELLLALASSAGSATHVFASVTHSQPR
jgi:hypothetical protein